MERTTVRGIVVHHRPIPRHSSVTVSLALPPDLGSTIMPDYRAFIVGYDGHFQQAIEMVCLNDEEAIEQAKQYVDGHDVELWQLGRRVAQLKHKPE